MVVRTRKTYAAMGAENRAAQAASAAGGAGRQRRVKRLYVVRESSAYKWLLFEAMMRQILERHSGVSSVDKVLALGADLVRPGPDGDRLRAQFEHEEMRRRGRRGKGPRARVVAYLIFVDGDAFLLSQMSASRTDERGENQFGVMLAEIVSRLRPEEMLTGPATRFGRTTQVFGQVGDAVKAAECRVFTDEAPDGLDLSTPNDMLRWDMYGLIAAAEVRELLKRMTIGRLLQARDGRWPLGRRQIVLGYECDAEGRPRVSSDPVVASWVRELIKLGADERLSLGEITERMIGMGLSTHKLQDYYGRSDADDDDLESTEGSLGAAVRPQDVVARLYGHLETYLSGDYRFELTCPVMGVTEWCSVPVHRPEGDSYGSFELTLSLGLPDGGWAPDETIRKAIALRCEMSRSARPQGGAAHEVINKPFAGFPSWQVGDCEATLSSRVQSYQVLERESRHAGRGWRDGIGRGRSIAAINPGELHRSFAERVIATLDEEGIDPAAIQFAVTGGERGVSIRAHVDGWAESIAKMERANAGIAQSIGLARADGNEAMAKVYESSLAQNLIQIETLKERIEHEKTLQERPQPREADVENLPEVLRLLQMGRSQFDPVVCDRLHHFVRDLRFVPGPFIIEWSCRLLLSTDDGVISVPVSGSVRNASHAKDSRAEEVRSARSEELRRLWVDGGMPLAAIAEHLGLTDVDSVQRRIRRVIVDAWPVTPAMRHALIACPIADVRRVIDRHANGVPPLTPWEQLIVRTYTGIGTWVQGWWADDLGDRQRVIDAIVARADTPADLDAGVPLLELAELSGVDPDRIRIAMASAPNSRGGRLTAPLFGQVLEKDKWTRGAPEDDKRIRIRLCPWCETRTVTLVRRVPEAGTSPILCSTCLRRPDDPDGVVFPTDYGEGLEMQARRAHES